MTVGSTKRNDCLWKPSRFFNQIPSLSFLGGKKNRQKERRLMKGFNLATVGGGGGGGAAGSIGSQTGLACSTPSLAGSTYLPTSAAACSRASMQTLNETSPVHSSAGKGSASPSVRSPITKLAQLARLAGKQKVLDAKKNRWGNLIEAAKSARGVGRMWNRSRSRSEDSVSSDGSGQQQQAAAATAEGDQISNSSRKEKSRVRARTSYPLGVVHVTENELPEVLEGEESGIDYELSGRMGIESINNTHSPSVNLRRFRRACSEPADQVTLILESKLSLPLEATLEMSEGSSRSIPAALSGRASPCIVGLVQQQGSSSIPYPSPSPGATSPRWAHQKLPDGFPFMDDSSASDPATSASDAAPDPSAASCSVYKSYNGAPTMTTADPSRQPTISGQVLGIQPLGRHQMSGGGWL